MADFLVATFYKFVNLPDYKALRKPLFDLCEHHEVKGTLLLAEEGINGTIAAPAPGVNAVLAYLHADPRLASLEHKESWARQMPFYRLKVKCKREIVTMGVSDVRPATQAGTYVKPEDWNRLIDSPDVVVVDVRNDYEVAIGSFADAVNPHTESFTQFPQWVKQQSENGLFDQHTRIAMFCTGGIRCEKSTAYLRSQGFDQVYHLEGGILKYLEAVPPEQSRWNGECFVFDERVSVGHGLAKGHHDLCRACRMPLNEADKASTYFVEGVSCPHCHGTHTPAQEQRFRERQKQVDLARARRQRHIGVRMEKQSVAGTAPPDTRGAAE
ncbi:MAG: rhodanese-related sulfurtransferase [Burkholderiaceae bacterium]|nr:MAG: rhodanese-related sulfurtransferase [Burkholderiaceae bacterium]TAM06527.1 MAG: rhodanese-related sulfurtransferase [Pusillimonas sp.]